MSPAILIAAMLLDSVMGEPRWLWSRAPHPAVLMGRMIGWADRHLNNNTRLVGAVTLVVLCGVAGVIGAMLTLIGPLAEILITAVLLAQRSLVQHVQAVARDLRVSLPSARYSVSMIVSRDTKDMAPDAIARAAMESGAENMSDGVIAPAFWALIGGLPGILIYKVVNTADSMIGYRTARHENFGWAAARFDDLLNWIPARLTAALFWLAGGAQGHWSHIRAEAVRHKSPNAGWPEAAMARGLGVALAGPRVYHGTLQDLPWVNPHGKRHTGAGEVEKSVHHLWRVWALFVMLLTIILYGTLVI